MSEDPFARVLAGKLLRVVSPSESVSFRAKSARVLLGAAVAVEPTAFEFSFAPNTKESKNRACVRRCCAKKNKISALHFAIFRTL